MTGIVVRDDTLADMAVVAKRAEIEEILRQSIGEAGGDPFEAARFLMGEMLLELDRAGEVRLDSQSGRPPRIGPGSYETVTMSFTGRSPCLHEIKVRTRVGIAKMIDRHIMAMELVRRLSGAMAYQAVRHEDACRLWRLDGPLDPGRKVIDIEHLHMDRSLVDITRGTAIPTRARVMRAIERVSSGAGDLYDGGARLLTSSGHMIEGRRLRMETLPVRSVGFTLHRGPGGMTELPVSPESASFDGETLRIFNQDIPQTTIAAMSGRMVGDIVRVHEDLDERVVSAAGEEQGVEGPTVVLTLVPDLVPLYAVA